MDLITGFDGNQYDNGSSIAGSVNGTLFDGTPNNFTPSGGGDPNTWYNKGLGAGGTNAQYASPMDALMYGRMDPAYNYDAMVKAGWATGALGQSHDDFLGRFGPLIIGGLAAGAGLFGGLGEAAPIVGDTPGLGLSGMDPVDFTNLQNGVSYSYTPSGLDGIDAAMNLGYGSMAPEGVLGSTAGMGSPALLPEGGLGLSSLDPLEYAMQQSGFEYLPEAQSFGAPVASATPTYAAEPIDEGSLWENISTPFKQANSMLDQALNTPEARLMQRAGQAKSLYDKLQGPDTSALERMQQQLQAYRTTGQQSQSFNPSREFGYANFNPRYGRI